MRSDTGDLLVDDLKLDPLKYKTHTYFREGVGVLPYQQSPWLLREFFNRRDFHWDRISHAFFLVFSPEHVFMRRSVYEILEGKKFFLGCALNAEVVSSIQILTTCDIHILFDRGVVEAISVLFFLNQ